MPDTYVQLPDGSYVQVPPDASPAQLQQFKIKLAGMQTPPQGQGTSTQNQGTIGPPTKSPITNPTNLGYAGADAIRNYIQQAQNLTQQGKAQHPIQNMVGKAAGFLVGGSQGIGSEGGGILTNPVLGSIIGTGPGSSAAEAVASKLPSATAAASRAQAGKTIGNIMDVAGKIPVDTGKFGEPLLDLFTQHGYGATLPPPARKLLMRLTSKESTALTLDEAKGFQSQITDFLANPVGANGARIKDPNMFRLMGALNQGLKSSIESASQVGGFNPGTFTGAMKQFSDAAQKEAMINRIHELAIKGLKFGAGALGVGALTGLGYDAYKILHPSTSGK